MFCDILFVSTEMQHFRSKVTLEETVCSLVSNSLRVDPSEKGGKNDKLFPLKVCPDIALNERVCSHFGASPSCKIKNSLRLIGTLPRKATSPYFPLPSVNGQFLQTRISSLWANSFL